MSDEPQDVEGSATELPPEAAEAIEDYLPELAAVANPADMHDVAIVLDEHDVAMLVRRAQGAALRKWVYDLDDGKQGLSIDGVQDVVQQMTWTGKAKIGILPETLSVERITEDTGNGPEPLWVATIFARDELTGLTYPGASMQPVMMQLKAQTAAAWRRKGKNVPEDDRVFDVFSRTKAISKATRNALAAFIPEELEQTIIAMVTKNPSRVERVQTEAEKQADTAEPMLTSDEAKAVMAECEAIYDRIRELGDGQGKVKFPPGQFRAWLLRSWHDLDALARFREYLLQQEADLPGVLQAEGEERRAAESVLEIACPICRQGSTWRCAQVDREGVVLKDDRDKPKLINNPHRERYDARLAQIRGAS